MHDSRTTSLTQPIGGRTSGMASWHQYTGTAFNTWWPPEPNRPIMGYYLNYSLVSVHILPPNPNHGFPPEPSHPGTVMSGFFRFGGAASDCFISGPTDASQPYTLGDVYTTSGPVTITPEPSSLVLSLVLGVCMIVVGFWRRRVNGSAGNHQKPAHEARARHRRWFFFPSLQKDRTFLAGRDAGLRLSLCGECRRAARHTCF